jgi:hypothetical protein
MSPPERASGPAAGKPPERLEDDALFDGEVIVVLPEGVSLGGGGEPDEAAVAAAPPPARAAARSVPRPAPVAARAPAAPRPAQRRRAPVPDEVVMEVSREAAGFRAAAPSAFKARAAGLLLGGLLAIIAAVGWRYYLTPPALRPFHFQHSALRPSGPIGLTLGILGTVVILATLAYSLRKRLVSWGRVGSLRGWMTWHVLAGVGGPAMILFHSSFAPASAIGLLAFSAMWVAVASGFVGRYIHVHLPKAADGRELDFQDIRSRLFQYRRKLVSLGVHESLLPAEAELDRRREWLWLIHALAAVLWGDRSARREFERLRQALTGSMGSGPEREQALRLGRRLCEGRQSLARLREIRRLMAAWRFFHGWFVVILLAGILFHVAIAVKYGGLWILGGRK